MINCKNIVHLKQHKYCSGWHFNEVDHFSQRKKFSLRYLMPDKILFSNPLYNMLKLQICKISVLFPRDVFPSRPYLHFSARSRKLEEFCNPVNPPTVRGQMGISGRLTWTVQYSTVSNQSLKRVSSMPQSTLRLDKSSRQYNLFGYHT